jgi:hypothetical protein
MKKIVVLFSFFILLSGCSGLQVAQNVPEAVELYGADCARFGHEEGTDPHADCVYQTWKMAAEKERANAQRKEMLRLIRGNDLKKAGLL